ncbi:amidohydrolase [Microbulbifer variabilis]|uniref:amidohydrolase n=1 Tax=Microbulbifer variabilis TaxID=266805 RepID=UPI00036CABDA|nr:amidohydrolase family protein [Microbulbifer variabilis]
MNPNQPKATAVAILNGKIIYVGNDKGAKKYIGDKTDVVALNGKYVTPGFIESHSHVVASAWTTMGVDLSAARSVDDIGRILKDYVEENPNEKGPLIGFGWMPANIGARGPRAKDLDKWNLGRPTIAIGNAVHDAGLNTLALRAAGIDNNTPDIQPGVMFWERDKENNITGLGIEVIFFDAFIKIGAWQPEKMVPESIDKLQGFLAKQGVTTAMVPGLVTPAAAVSSELSMEDMREIMAILKRRADRGEAQMRLNVMPMFKLPDADPQEFVDFTLEMKSLYNDDMVRVDKVKIHPELAWNQRGATQLVPYLPENKDDAPTWGKYGVTPDRIFEVINRANKNGLDVITHADGARLIKRLTEIIIEAKKHYPDARNRLDHISMMDLETREKVVKNNIPTNATPMFVNELDAGLKGKVIYQYMPRDYIEEALSPYQELANKYDNVSLSGDTPAAPIDRAYPIYLMQQSMTNKEPSIEGSTAFPPWRPTLTIDQALHAYTVAPAWQMRMEDKIGSIEVGKYADMAIFEKSLRDIEPDNLIEEAKVVGTLLNGKFTHRENL